MESAPDRDRVDLVEPAFSDPTSVTNPLFPISTLAQVIQVGAEAGAPLRHEVTLLPRTKTIPWNGRQVETVVSQFMGYRDGRIIEVAQDYFAQADDGSVWYFGENVDNYENGVVVDHEGTWLAGRDGPPGMIMPAAPRVGDVYRPENIPDLVFEEVTVQAVDERVDGPNGAVDGALLVRERLLDGTLEDKVFAPGFGEFRAEVASDDELVTVSVAAPVQTRASDEPRDLVAISGRAAGILDALASPDWARMAADVADLTAAWDRYRTRAVPPLIEEQMAAALQVLSAAVAAHKRDGSQRGATDVAQAALDLSLQHWSAGWRHPPRGDRSHRLLHPP